MENPNLSQQATAPPSISSVLKEFQMIKRMFFLAILPPLVITTDSSPYGK
jgi:hypothetical protein